MDAEFIHYELFQLSWIVFSFNFTNCPGDLKISSLKIPTSSLNIYYNNEGLKRFFSLNIVVILSTQCEVTLNIGRTQKTVILKF